jgi:hypothetical protein
MRNLLSSLVVAAAALCPMLWSQQAGATEWRGCRGAITVQDGGTYDTVWEFEGRGSCKNRANANDCRRAAKGAIEDCAREAWRTRWDRKLPHACRPISGSSRAHVKGIADTSFGRGPGAEGDQDFKWAVERAACCRMHPNRDRVTVTVGAASFGDKGCQSEKAVEVGKIDVVLEGNYAAECRAARARGVCN